MGIKLLQPRSIFGRGAIRGISLVLKSSHRAKEYVPAHQERFVIRHLSESDGELPFVLTVTC